MSKDQPVSIAPTVPKYIAFDRVVHLKTDTMYLIIGTPNEYRIESTGEPAYAYRVCDDVHDKDQRVWIRSQTLMEDGRFVTAKEWVELRINPSTMSVAAAMLHNSLKRVKKARAKSKKDAKAKIHTGQQSLCKEPPLDSKDNL